MANTYWQDKGSTEILSSHISGLQDAVKNIEQSLDMDTEVVSGYPLVLIPDADDNYRIAEAKGKRNWLNSPAPVVQQNIEDSWTTITDGFSIDYAGGAIIFDGDKTGEQFRASFTRVKNTSEFNTHKAESIKQYEETKYLELSSVATNKDTEGVYKNIEWKRTDNTLYAKSILVGSLSPYEQVKIDYYSEDGNVVIKTITWDLTYDNNEFPYKKEVI